MFKKVLSISAIALAFCVSAQAQSKAEKTETIKETKMVEKVEPFTADEEAAAKQRILNYEEKISANKENPALDYEAELKTIAKMKSDFNKRASTKFDQ